MESCIRISLSEYINLDQSQRFDHSGRNEIWREPFPPARTCDRGGGSPEPGQPGGDPAPPRAAPPGPIALCRNALLKTSLSVFDQVVNVHAGVRGHVARAAR